MGFKVNHYAAKTISRSYTMDWETVSIELIIGIICGVLAVAGYKASMLLVFIPATLITVICLMGILYSLYNWVQGMRANKATSSEYNPDETRTTDDQRRTNSTKTT